jgi:catechol 2,3-dioxygenase-like lactoylglutathione lyase family enzyme
MIRAFDHTSFTVPSIDVAVAFWRDAMGFTVASDSLREGPFLGAVVGLPGARARIAHLHGHGQHLEFIEYLDPPGQPALPAPNDRCAGHVAFVSDDVAADTARLVAAGAIRQGAVTAVTGGPYVGASAVYLRDPNGVILEIYQPAVKP